MVSSRSNELLPLQYWSLLYFLEISLCYIIMKFHRQWEKKSPCISSFVALVKCLAVIDAFFTYHLITPSSLPIRVNLVKKKRTNIKSNVNLSFSSRWMSLAPNECQRRIPVEMKLLGLVAYTINDGFILIDLVDVLLLRRVTLSLYIRIIIE